jgi:hypothetical protein
MTALPQMLAKCCNRVSGQQFAAPGPQCPSATPVIKLSFYNSSGDAGGVIMRGFAEFGGQSVPPRFYRSYSVDGEIEGVFTGLGDDTSFAYSAEGLGASAWKFDPTTGGLASSSGLSDARLVDDVPPSGDDYGVLYGLSLLNYPTLGPGPSGASYTSGGNYVGFFSINDNAVFTVISQTEIELSGPPLYGTNSGSITVSLNTADEETEANAIAQATPSAATHGDDFSPGDGTVYTEYDQRGAGALGFQYVTGVYALLLENLTPGVMYTVTVVWSKRTSNMVGGTLTFGSWGTDPTDDTFTVAATAANMVINGSWDGTLSGGVPDYTHVTPTTAMRLVQGWQYQIQALYVEPAGS